ncbi:MAG TPA: alanine--glyoxylate aminotransferase family protein [Zoogloea sp.]|uniref:pyridoxal-phosphate-dependent aminotransferase family protein n=1 Tax=Zoogloea sp. TaxID=49181 RepID=UPI002D0E9602|nr:alanine--glyoxylate aminotransferase family protein [Zoogloea sp.]HMV17763.1 alanine--glyoxylate aminotransferase family protein [Rhodocyclaceae bacterium]HMV63498.1 alanine--glyoxylate aminotransferase family protein [Rhodocyclaceae bacterium]HMW52974.1 alanine--glyoxylate aminotransferase family protein [Rhodocyclaceae bacterium]HMY48983.1 alanine--glyoxylate aminotransferase family protein [Rhodocyclaceae bacterium]HMZ75251.1 alanine--glyoxylate aminotransferase family protein [Rhodocycl
MIARPELRSFQPPVRTLMGPGPSDVPPRVLAALARPTVGHLDPAFVGMMDELKELLRYTFQTRNELTFPVSAPGSVGMETCVVNLVSPGDTVVVCINGVFGQRLAENVRRAGGVPVIVEDPWGEPVDPAKVEDTFKAHPEASLLAFVHAETSTGALSDAAALAAIARRFGALTLMDCVTSLGGVPVLLDEWGIDAAYSGSQKCLSCTPGLSPVSFSEAAVARIRARKTPCQSWFQDLSLVLGYWSGAKRTYHHTAPVNPLYGLHESLLMLAEEGLEAAWQRHRDNHLRLRAGLEALGLRFVVREDARLPQLNTVWVPDGVDEAAARTRLLKEYGLEIGAGLGVFAGKVWRIGLMGHSSRPANIALCLAALKDVLG